MSNYYDLVQWQLVDPSNNLVKPWFTWPFLEELDGWDLKDAVVLEYGGGRSTAWWRSKARLVVTIETSQEWKDNIFEECKKSGVPPGVIIVKDVHEGDRTREHEYVFAHNEWLKNHPYQIVVVDGIFRYECMIHAIELLRERGGKIIVDNWDQDGFLCPACVTLMEPYKGHIYPQPGHIDHHGNCWKTAYFEIPAI